MKLRRSLFLFLLAIPLHALALPATHIGKVLFVTKTAQAISKTNARRFLKPGSPLYIGDTLLSHDGRVKLRLREGNNEVFMAENSSITLEKASNMGRANSTTLVLNDGEVRCVVKIKYSGRGTDRFTLKTPVAQVDVKGTVFIAKHNAQKVQSTFATLEGILIVKGNHNLKNPVQVDVGQYTEVLPRRSPSDPQDLLASKDLRDIVMRLAEGTQYGIANIKMVQASEIRAKELFSTHKAATPSSQISQQAVPINEQPTGKASQNGPQRSPSTTDAIEKILVKSLGI